MHPRLIHLFASLYGLLGVALGAFGAHAFKARLTASNMTNTWQTAEVYTLVHAVGLLAVAALVKGHEEGSGRNRLKWAATCWIAGVALFSGSLFALALGGPSWLGPVTPLGGLALLLGWGLLLVKKGEKLSAPPS